MHGHGNQDQRHGSASHEVMGLFSFEEAAVPSIQDTAAPVRLSRQGRKIRTAALDKAGKLLYSARLNLKQDAEIPRGPWDRLRPRNGRSIDR